ncbi:transporter substrate-binding domain-containing protein [Bosea sp. UC22_33]|uniref:transporter substrate-binding domain-containing protein n=1 Tax=Bosea sp. UC22_33 TaxID=3350165 RepID=UPI00366F9FC9
MPFGSRPYLGARTCCGNTRASPARRHPAAGRCEIGRAGVGIETTYPPMAFKVPKSHERAGFNVELVKAIARDLGIAAKWEEMRSC